MGHSLNRNDQDARSELRRSGHNGRPPVRAKISRPHPDNSDVPSHRDLRDTESEPTP
jgi:hypothetical protein